MTFEVLAVLGEDMEFQANVEAKASVVYGEAYNEEKMTEAVMKGIEGFEGWGKAVRQLRERLVARGEKGARKA